MAASPAETDRLLKCGVLAGPVYVVVGLLQVIFRDGFDIRRHALSLMSNGSLGWIQVASFIVSGLLVIAAAAGMRQRLHPGRAGTWGPILLGLYGLGLIGAGIFVADPMDGFPPGTPAGPPGSMSWHGPLHFMAGGIGFIGLVGATLVFARRFVALRDWRWATFSLATGVLFLAGFANIASGARAPWINLAFTAVVVLSWAWLSAVSAKLMTPRAGVAARG
jgi:hypothetical protein